ncbi:L,D-transpeptidase [Gluconobacter sp. GP1]|uniref:L,D-transpeptidase n=1 Tax=Gluconobacter sp. GP1 TaxID=3046423 RepID=UPI00293F14D1|nr:L,D-transpeptidase [Gluconobacter sp. GP1]
MRPVSTLYRSARLLVVTTALCGGGPLLSACAHADPTPPASSAPGGDVSVPAPASNPVTDATPVVPAVQIPPLPVVSNAEAHKEAARLVKMMAKTVKGFTTYKQDRRDAFVSLAQAEVAKANQPVSRPQLIMVVDRNERIQHLDFVLALPDEPWVSLGGTPVSTGTTGRKYYYITPTGVFQNSADRLGYRAEGTKNKYGIRGIGAKGSRVWDMGWQTAMKGWLPKHETGQIRLEIHATDPQFLEWRLGHSASEGCIRIPATMNRFMDHYGLIDALYEQAASYDPRFAALLPKDREATPIAGDLVVVVDSGPLTEPKIDPIADKRPLP